MGPASFLFAAVLALAGCGREPPAPPPGLDAGAPAVVPSAAVSAAAPAEPTGGVADGGPAVETDAGAAPADMITLPAGIFLMGSPISRGSPEERPMHEVVVAAFDLDRTEVRTRDYLACLSAGACTRPHEDNGFCNTSKSAAGREDHPINCIDAHQAEAYCASAGKRLPTEREWEYAARGGAEERRFSWGEEDPTGERACYFHIGSCPVASFAPGAFGLFDMSGNVWEWTSSWFGTYPDAPKTGTARVYRGGSWSRRFPKWLSTAMRNRYDPGSWSASLGVRCARSRLPLACPADTEARDGACVRVHGTPRCEPTLSWNGDACTPGGAPTLKGSGSAEGTVATPGTAAPGTAAPAPGDEEPISKARTPQHDPDCLAHYAGKPAAYRYSGATFHKRNRPLEAAGCTRRDMGLTWTSVCCPQ
jgi:sulfatase modifying factor 1